MSKIKIQKSNGRVKLFIFKMSFDKKKKQNKTKQNKNIMTTK